MKTDDKIADAVSSVYTWIDSEIKGKTPCKACGKCCDFKRFDHRLFVTGVELIHFVEAIGKRNIKPMEDGVCPYKVDGKCTVYENRFAGCRIFSCRGDGDFQSHLTEKAMAKLKSIHQNFSIDYKYVDLASGLNNITELG